MAEPQLVKVTEMPDSSGAGCAVLVLAVVLIFSSCYLGGAIRESRSCPAPWPPVEVRP